VLNKITCEGGMLGVIERERERGMF
jgi:hypothetical protein